MSRDNEMQPVQDAEEQFKEHLLAIGLLTEITPRLDPQDVPRQRQPAPVFGNPVSELVIQERR